jgi:uncharacterized repeat protein (TIGR02543 family)/LPXTG-motif cell wall-anchored protein
MKKKIILIALSILLMASLLPVTALAATGDYHIDGVWVGQELADGTVEIIGYTGGEPSGVVTLPSTIAGYTVTGIVNNLFSGKTGITGVVIPAGVTYIGSGAFSSCSSLTTVTFADGSQLEAIGNGAFSSDTALHDVSLPGTLKTIGISAFNGCTHLETVTMGNNVTAIETSAFEGCTALSSINLSTKLTSIGLDAFKNCSALHTVTIPASLTSIGTYAFQQSGLTSIDIPATVQTIEASAFNGCSSLASVTLHEGLVTIGDAAFLQIPITEIVIPSTVTTIGNAAFASCTSLKRATILNAEVATAAGVLDSSVFGSAGLSGDGIYGFAESTAQAYATSKEVPFHMIYKITFDSKGGSAVPWDYAVMEGTVTKPADPTRAHYVFGGWYADEALADDWAFDTDTITGAKTLYAKWTELTLASSDADGKIYTSGRVTLTPNIDGGAWNWDHSFFSATFNSPATFTALKAGTSTITYTVGGVSTTYTVTIAASALPSTGQDFTWVWVLAGSALAALTAVAVLTLRKRTKRV